MSPIRHFDHVGITVVDLDTVTGFFVGLGFETEGRTVLEGEFLDTVIGIPDSRTEIVMLRPPDGGTALELASFIRPNHEPGSPDAMANELGLRSVAFEVDDLDGILDRLAADGYRLVGGVGQYEGTWRMASVRGPEGIIVSLPSESPDPRPSKPHVSALPEYLTNRLCPAVPDGRPAALTVGHSWSATRHKVVRCLGRDRRRRKRDSSFLRCSTLRP